MTPAERYEYEAEFARTHMPPSTMHVSDTDAHGWLYTITNDYGDPYDLFLWWDDDSEVYAVSLVTPRLGGELDPHGGHIFSDGQLCLTEDDGNGYRDIGRTYAKATVWTMGASSYRRGYGFQLNSGEA